MNFQLSNSPRAEASPTTAQNQKSDKYQHLRKGHSHLDRVAPQEESWSKWVSPTEVNKRRRFQEDQHGGGVPYLNLSSSFDADLNSSVVSLDFGLVSPRRNWSSPPQRIERAENREWSPHRVIDRPNPENSPGNWVPVKESCQHSLAPDCKNFAVAPVAFYQDQAPRSLSQNTYVVPEKIRASLPIQPENLPTRKTSVLLDYDPDRGGSTLHDGSATRKRTVMVQDQTQNNVPAEEEKIKRVVDSGGRIRKISTLGDYQVPNFGKPVDKIADDTNKENLEVEPASTATVKEKSKIGKAIAAKSSVPKKSKSKSEVNEVLELGGKDEENDKGGKALTTGSVNGDEETNNLTKNTKKMLMDLENILKDKSAEAGREEVIKKNRHKPEKKALPVEEKPQTVLEKKKRKIDTKVVHEFMKNQKQKRLEQMKTNKKTKVEEKEAIKKKLEELRVKTIQLAAQSKKKKPPVASASSKIIEQATEDDITMSLGLKQVKPKVSYNESVSNLKRKSPRVKNQGPKVDVVEGKAEVEESAEDEGNQKESPAKQFLLEKMSELPQLLKPASDLIAADVLSPDNLNSTLKKIAETLHLKIEEKERQMRESRPTSTTSKSLSPLSRVNSENSVRTNQSGTIRDSRKMIAIDLETIHSLKEDIKKISDNFKVLHEIIVEKAEKKAETVEAKTAEKVRGPETSGPLPKHENHQNNQESLPLWLHGVLPRPHPYNVYTAFRRKMNLHTSQSLTSVTSHETSPYAGTLSNKYDSEYETLSLPSDRLRSPSKIVERISSKKGLNSNVETGEGCDANSLKDSGSEFSSSIFDRDKNTLGSVKTHSESHVSDPSRCFLSSRRSRKGSVSSSIITEIMSKSIHLTSSNGSNVAVDFRNERENLILVTPDVRLIPNDLSEKTLNDFSRNLNSHQEEKLSKTSFESRAREELISTDKSNRNSTVTDIIDNLSENDSSVISVKATNKKCGQTVAVQKIEEAHIRRTFFQPEMLHLQFQAELSLLETFQQSLSHFLEAERMKTLTEVSKIVYEKSVNREKEKEDQAVQTTFVKEHDTASSKTENDLIKTDINVSDEEAPVAEEEEEEFEDDDDDDDDDDEVSEDEEIKTEKTVSLKTDRQDQDDQEVKTSDIPEEINTKKSSAEVSEVESQKELGTRRVVETSDFSVGQNVISFQMLNRMIKDEELRSEHQLALIRLREKTLNEKVKAELTFLEMKKRALKEGGGGDEEQTVSAIKKKQRGILLKYQSEKEEIERLKKMHKIASEERKIMIKQQKQIQKMQLSTKDMLIKLRRREKSPLKKSPLKPKALKLSSDSDIQEDIALELSDSILTESDIYSMENSIGQPNESDVDVLSWCNISGEENEKASRRNRKRSENKIILGMGLLSPKKVRRSASAADLEKQSGVKSHPIDDLLNWTKRLEEKANRIKEIEAETIKSASTAKSRTIKSTKGVKSCMKDRSTSPFQFPDSYNFPTEKSTTINEVIDGKNSSEVSEEISESIVKADATEKTGYGTEKIQNSISEDIPVEFSKANGSGSGSRTLEYYSQSFESPSLNSEAAKTKVTTPRSKTFCSESGGRTIPIKLSLSPRIQSPRRRNSSGSDDSINLSHTETASEQSDLESRIAALHEQLEKRKIEAERLRREQKKAQREKLKVKEQSLLKQIQAYDAYIQKKKLELEQEYEHSFQSASKPLIKQPKVVEKSNAKKQESLLLNYARATGKVREKDASNASRKVSESDSEIPEQIKGISESIKEEIKTLYSNQEGTSSSSGRSKDLIESQIEGETEGNDAVSAADVETSLIETSELIKDSVISAEEIPEPEIDVGKSLSENEDQSISIKTTLESPEKQDTEVGETKEKTELIETDVASADIDVDLDLDVDIDIDNLNDNLYQSDSFESDFEEKSSTKASKTQGEAEVSGIETNMSGEITESVDTVAEGEEQEVEQEEEGELEEMEQTPENRTEIEKTASDETLKPEQETHEAVSPTEESESEIKSEICENENKEERADQIADSLILDLLRESLKTYSTRKQEVEKKVCQVREINAENLAGALSKGVITAAIDDTLTIYNHRKVPVVPVTPEEQEREEVEEMISPERITSDVRKRICEIMAQSSGVKEQRRPQDMMVTTYDVSPRGSPIEAEEGENTESEEKEEFLRSLIPGGKEEKLRVFGQQDLGGNQHSKGGTFGQEWFDDDFGLSRRRREAEELRLQQLQIEQEIQQLQAQQEHIPYFYLREIPNKPPPPYTPPGKPLSEIPTSAEEVVSIATAAVRILTEQMFRGNKSIAEVEPTQEFYGKATVSEHVRCYKKFLFDLTRHIVEDVFRRQSEKGDVLPWTKTRTRLSFYRYNRIERTLEGLSEHVKSRVMVLFGFSKKVAKENLVMRCFKKKRDHVDEILVSELQEEETEWTEFDEDQVRVKNEVAQSILDGLLMESAQLIGGIVSKRMKKA